MQSARYAGIVRPLHSEHGQTSIRPIKYTIHDAGVVVSVAVVWCGVVWCGVVWCGVVRGWVGG
jgi:hypothetical protein